MVQKVEEMRGILENSGGDPAKVDAAVRAYAETLIIQWRERK
jgi:hypothetical protein